MGNCSRCGACCKVLPVGYVRDLKPGQKEYLLTHGCMIEHGTVLVPLVCPHLKPTLDHFIDGEQKRYSCDIYEERPQACKDFDGRHLSHGRKYFVPDSCTMSKK